jgi:hypothetical protein
MNSLNSHTRFAPLRFALATMISTSFACTLNTFSSPRGPDSGVVAMEAGSAQEAGGADATALTGRLIVNSGGWGWRHPRPQGNDLRDVWVVGNEFWMVGDANTVLRGDLDKQTLERVELASSDEVDFVSVWASADEVLALGATEVARLDLTSEGPHPERRELSVVNPSHSKGQAVFRFGSDIFVASGNGVSQFDWSDGTPNKWSTENYLGLCASSGEPPQLYAAKKNAYVLDNLGSVPNVEKDPPGIINVNLKMQRMDCVNRSVWMAGNGLVSYEAGGKTVEEISPSDDWLLLDVAAGTSTVAVVGSHMGEFTFMVGKPGAKDFAQPEGFSIPTGFGGYYAVGVSEGDTFVAVGDSGQVLAYNVDGVGPGLEPDLPATLGQLNAFWGTPGAGDAACIGAGNHYAVGRMPGTSVAGVILRHEGGRWVDDTPDYKQEDTIPALFAVWGRSDTEIWAAGETKTDTNIDVGTIYFSNGAAWIPEFLPVAPDSTPTIYDLAGGPNDGDPIVAVGSGGIHLKRNGNWEVPLKSGDTWRGVYHYGDKFWVAGNTAVGTLDGEGSYSPLLTPQSNYCWRDILGDCSGGDAEVCHPAVLGTVKATPDEDCPDTTTSDDTRLEHVIVYLSDPTKAVSLGMHPILSRLARVGNGFWAAGNKGTIIHWKADDLTPKTLPDLKLSTGTNRNLRDIAAFSTTDIWVVGRRGAILHFDDKACATQ